jgi:cyclopropane fatty-acyl-phospholipid synthase-like methyltransferase
MRRNDKAIWESITAQTDVAQLEQAFHHPLPFQIELVTLLTELLQTAPAKSSIEIGSSFGITTALLPADVQRSILDLNANALGTAAKLFAKLQIPVKTYTQDFFNITAVNKKFGLVFNAGVLEHFNKSERQSILTSMAGLTIDGGYVVVGVPNHTSLPYRLGYLYRRITRQWPYPQELKIRELSLPGLQLIAQHGCDKQNIYRYLPHRIQPLFKFLDTFCRFEAYLKIFVFRKIGE